MSVDLSDPKVRARFRYEHDPGYRQRKINSARRAQGLPLLSHPRKTTWSITEIASILNVRPETIIRYEKAGIVPRHTYPTQKRIYWSYQALLVVKLFARMRSEGWPHRIPQFSTFGWTRFLGELQSKWTSKGPVHVDWEAGSSHNDKDH